MNRDDVIVMDILRAANLAVDFTQNMSKAGFLTDVKTQSAVLHQIMVMGEAVKRLSTEFRTLHTELPWREMAGMRDVLIHGYDTVDLNEVWKTVRTDIPQILPHLESLMSR